MKRSQVLQMEKDRAELDKQIMNNVTKYGDLMASVANNSEKRRKDTQAYLLKTAGDNTASNDSSTSSAGDTDAD